MTEYSDKACKKFLNGCNCAQSVLCAFSDKIGLDERTAMKLASSFGGGMGRLREVCGAVSAMFMIAGLLKGYERAGDDIGKTRQYQLVQNLAGKFKAQHGTIICRELLGLDGADNPIPSKRTSQYYTERPCEDFVRTAAEIIETELLD
jgi:C_GCAxxG_C_C family probable redox protein